jgi:hypothetical protein
MVGWMDGMDGTVGMISAFDCKQFDNRLSLRIITELKWDGNGFGGVEGDAGLFPNINAIPVNLRFSCHSKSPELVSMRG